MIDLIVIGGGVNGTGIARDAAMRGLSVTLIERHDFGVGASGNSSSMIHGGVRYLLSDTEVTRTSSLDSGFIQRIAPHLLYRIPFIYPFVKGAKGSWLSDLAYLYAAESFLGLYDRFQPLKNGKPSTRLTAAEALRLEPGLRKDLVGAITLDEWGVDAARLCVLNAVAAAELGADLHTYTEVLGLLRDETGRIIGVKALDRLTHRRKDHHAKMVFNATGAWSPRLARGAGLEIKMRPGKGVHLVLDRKVSNYGVITKAADGRELFIMPLENASIIGTTDDDYYGDPGELSITQDEIAYLMQGVEHMVPDVRRARVVRAYAGVRPTLYAYGRGEEDLSRDHLIIDHARDGSPGMLSMIGGKLAAYRLMSQEAVDRLETELRRPISPCNTHTTPLPGGEHVPDPLELAAKFRTPAWETERIVHRHGARAKEVLQLAADDRRLAVPVCQCEGVLGAEIVHCIRHESVRRLADLTRRCRLAMGSCAGTGCARTAATLFAQEKGLNAAETREELRVLLQELWRWRRSVLDGPSLAQESMGRGSWFGIDGLDRDAMERW